MADRSWDRVEPHTRSENLEEGLQARVADPLWMLARQWQLGEFRGEDAASPVHARVESRHNLLHTWRNDTPGAGGTQRLDTSQPLETRVEAEVVATGPAAIAIAAQAGLQFLRRLDDAGLSGLRADFRDEYSLVLADSDLDGLPSRQQQRLSLLARRALDGHLLSQARPAHLAAVVGASADPLVVQALFDDWLLELGDRFQEPSGGQDAWADERLEYSFSVGVPAGQGEVVLGAPEYTGGHLDWHSFDVDTDPAASHGHGSRSPVRRRVELLPVPLAYAGMPASRWWEFEEGTVSFGAIEAGPADIGRLIVAEYASVYSDDWFLVPLRLPVGCLARVKRVTVLDTFGGKHVLKSTAVGDAATASGERPWAWFELAGDPSASEGRTPWLLLPPALVSPLQGRPVEQVGLLRDEQANLGWAVESVIELPTGEPMRRRLSWGLARQAMLELEQGTDTPLPSSEDDDPWGYQLQSQVPPYWIPLVPEPIAEGSAEMRLRRARMLAWDDIPFDWAKGPKGRILAPERALRLHEEEVPRGGLEVTRRWQLARGADGQVHLWMARQRRPGRGERGSGLAHDTMAR